MKYTLRVQYKNSGHSISVGQSLSRLEVRAAMIDRMIDAERECNVLAWTILPEYENEKEA